MRKDVFGVRLERRADGYGPPSSGSCGSSLPLAGRERGRGSTAAATAALQSDWRAALIGVLLACTVVPSTAQMPVGTLIESELNLS
jgi:hypothetical protein